MNESLETSALRPRTSMLPPRLIPVLLLKDSGLVKGVRFRRHKYVGDPMNAVRIFNEKKADEIVLLDIAATRRGSITALEFVQRVADESYMPFGVGGGITTVREMQDLIRCGAEKVIVNTATLKTPDLVRKAADMIGSQSVVAAIDVGCDWLGRYRVYTHCGMVKTSWEPVDWAKRVEELGAGEIMVTSIERDGTGMGYDLNLVRRIVDAVHVPVIACGGAGLMEHVQDVVHKAGAAAAAAGSMFVFKGPLRSVLIQYPGHSEA